MTVQKKNYPIYFKSELSLQYANISSVIQNKYSKVYLIVDENTEKHCIPLLLNKIPSLRYNKISILGGEINKSILNSTIIWENLTKNNADRNILVINLGGGIVTDLGGFAASVYKRGVDFINIPTTLLAQVDASVGSKTGVNFMGYKNQLGLFSDPIAVFIDTDFLKTLDKRNLINGFGEIWKHALIADSNYWKVLKSNKYDLNTIIETSVAIKSSVVSKDHKESGYRKILNFGHTFAHAFETLASKNSIDILHGEAVIIGMLAETYLSKIVCGLKEESLNDIINFLKDQIDLNSFKMLITDDIIEFMLQDKKNKDGVLLFSLLKEIGEATFNISVNKDLVIKTINFLSKIK